MEWLNSLHGKTVAVDTAPFIYFIERKAPYINSLRPLFHDVDQGNIQVVTSVVTVIEVLVHPLRNGDDALARQYYDILLSSPHVTTAQVTFGIAELAAQLRADHGIKTPDAIQLATALSHRADCLITNDRDFGQHADIEIWRLDQLRA